LKVKTFGKKMQTFPPKKKFQNFFYCR
jgi:hypothetical protein